MTRYTSFVFSPFSENTYVVWDDSGECVIVDPGCLGAEEEGELTRFIEDRELRPVRLLLTHGHIDHVFGNRFVSGKWDLQVECHEGEQATIDQNGLFASMYGIPFQESPPIEVFHKEGDQVEFGKTRFEVIFTPGHSVAHICYYCKESGFVLCGDTLFRGSIGRTDLPGGDTKTLMTSIEKKLLILPDETRLLAGHMGESTVGEEIRSNPFVKAWREGMPIG